MYGMLPRMPGTNDPDGHDFAVVGKCKFCGTSETVFVKSDQYYQWMNGEAHIQDAFPHLTAGQRELIKTQMCDACWDDLMPPEE